MKILVTGATGFVGIYLVDLLLKKNHEVFGTSLHGKDLDTKAEILKFDLNDGDALSKAISDIKPEAIFHLAALTSPRESFKDPKGTFINNVGAQINLLEAVKAQSLKPRIMIISSAEVYGKVKPEDLPIDEEVPFNPTNPYAVSKLSQDLIALQYFNSERLDIVRLRPFNHTGPGQSDNFVVPAFAKKIAQVEKGQLEKLTVGNLESKRDFTDVRDMVKAYLLALEKGKSGEVYNLGSGRSHKISEILNSLMSLSNKEIKVAQDPYLMMPVDNPELTCNFSKFAKLTGWKPEIPIDQTLKETLDYWRGVV